MNCRGNELPNHVMPIAAKLLRQWIGPRLQLDAGRKIDKLLNNMIRAIMKDKL
jgi:hypothetical protein